MVRSIACCAARCDGENPSIGVYEPGCEGLAMSSDVAVMPPAIVAHAPAGIFHRMARMLHPRRGVGPR